MKLILGDNQFFGVNHADFEKARNTRKLFSNSEDIIDFIVRSTEIGLDGFMINSNDVGFDVVKNFDFSGLKTECHYSIPYPHKYASIVNESGILSLVPMVLKRIKINELFPVCRFLITRNAVNLLPVVVRLEIPDSLPRGSVVYLQNIVTDLIFGLNGGEEIIRNYIDVVQRMGYRPGLITLNPTTIYKRLCKNYSSDLYLCYNINDTGFNVFPSRKAVESITEKIKKNTNWTTVGMSIFSSGRPEMKPSTSIEYIKSLSLDYVVFGSSKLGNIKNNFDLFCGV